MIIFSINWRQNGQNVKGGENNYSELRFSFFRERMSNFSLRSRAIGPSDFFEPRSKAVLRSEGFAWVPVLGSFDKLREVGVLSYLFYLLFKCFVMFELI